MVVLMVLLTVISFLTIDYFVQRAHRRTVVAKEPLDREVFARTDIDELPGGVFVGPGHVWVEVEPQGSVRIGVDRLLLSFLERLDCVYTLPEGSEIHRGGPLVMLRRGDRALKIRSPVDGVICGVNNRARRMPDRIEKSPFDRGWIYRISPVRLADALEHMHVAEAASEWMSNEVERLRDFLTQGSGEVGPTLADGGLPISGLGAGLTDSDWEELVACFFRQPDREEVVPCKPPF